VELFRKNESKSRRVFLPLIRAGRYLAISLGLWSSFLSSRAAAPTCGLTIITHGFQLSGVLSSETIPSWVTNMAQSINDRTGASLPIYKVRYNKSLFLPSIFDEVVLEDGATAIDITSKGGAIVLLNWNEISNETEDYTTTDVASKFFDFIFATPQNGHFLCELPMHFIGHSRGASLNSALCYTLAARGIIVDQFTMLDPHPVEPLNIPSGNDWIPEIYINTIFADNYYEQGILNFPDGRPIAGTFFQDLSSVLTGAGWVPHGKVHEYYQGSIDLTNGVDAWFQNTLQRDKTGFNFSRYTNAVLIRPAAGVNQNMTESNGTGSRVAVPKDVQFWPNAGFDQRASFPRELTVGESSFIPYYFADWSSQQTVTFSLDNDTNPFNGIKSDISSIDQSSQSDNSIGKATLEWVPTMADIGTNFLRVKTTNWRWDIPRVRFDYLMQPFIVSAPSLGVPTVTTLAARDVGKTTGIIKGHIGSVGESAIVERRFEWGTTPTPGPTWKSSSVTGTPIAQTGNDFSATITGLTPNTTYFFQPWAKNASSQVGTCTTTPGWGCGNIFSFTTINDAPPTSINLLFTISPGVVAPNSGSTVSGTVSYNNGATVPAGTVSIVVDGRTWTATIVSGSFSRTIIAPGVPGNYLVEVNVADGLGRSGTSSETLAVLQNGNVVGYVINDFLMCESVDVDLPYDYHRRTDAFGANDSRVFAWLDIGNMVGKHYVDFRLYRPDGSYYGNAAGFGGEAGQTYDSWRPTASWPLNSSDIPNTAGRWTMQLYMDGVYQRTVGFTMRYELMAHRMAKDVQTSAPYEPLQPSNIFNQGDSKAAAWLRLDKVSDLIEMRWTFFEPSGSQYAEASDRVNDPNSFGYDYWESAKPSGWINIAGTVAANKCGRWSVDVSIKNPSGNWVRGYTDYFTIVEQPPQPPTCGVTLAGAASPGQTLTLSVSAADNTYLENVTLFWNDGILHRVAWNVLTSSFSQSAAIGSYSDGQQIEFWVEAKDTSGNAFACAHQAMVVTSPPSVEIGTPANHQTWNRSTTKVSGSASSRRNISVVRVRANGGAWTQAVGTTQWEASVGLVPGVNLIEAQSEDGTGVLSSATSISVTVEFENGFIFFDDMENGQGGWGADAPWAITATSSESPSHSWTDSPNGNYDFNKNISLVVPFIDLTGRSAATLTFWHRFDFGPGDSGNIWIQPEDGSFISVQSFSLRMEVWHEEAIDISAFAGHRVRIFFQLFSRSGGPGDGWHIDDVGVLPFVKPPTVNFISPANGESLSTSTVMINGTARGGASPNRGITSVQVRLNGGIWSTASGTSNWNYSFGLVLGNNLIESRAQVVDGTFSDITTINVSLSLPQGVVFFDDMENGQGGWTVTQGPWSLTTESSQSSTHSWSDSPGGNYQPNSFVVMKSPLIDLSVRSIAKVSFWHRFDFAAGDSGHVGVEPEGSTFAPTASIFSGSSTEWRHEVVDVSRFTGTKVRILFAVQSVSGVVADGWHIDDVVVTVQAPDDTPPTVSIISPVGGQTVGTSTFLVTGTASDPGNGSSGVSNVFVSVNGAAWRIADGKEIWSASVGLVPGNNSIRVQAQDYVGHYSTPSVINVWLELPVGLVFFDDMENGKGDWRVDALWGLIATDAHSPSQAWTNSPDGDYAPNRNVSLISPLIDLTGKNGTTLEFWHRFNLAWGDRGRIWVLPQTGNFSIPLRTFWGSSPDWHHETVDMSSYAGQRVSIYFQMFSDLGSEIADGWHIDDVAVTAWSNSLPTKVMAWGMDPDRQTNVAASHSYIVAISVGTEHSLALARDGTVVSWGESSADRANVPADLTNVIAISAGEYHNLALKADGTLVTWGSSLDGETDFPLGLTNIVSIAAGNGTSAVLKGDGSVLAWGFTGNDQTHVPSGLSNVIAISVHNNHSLALRRDGTVAAWGWNAYGQANVPAGLSNVIAVAAGGNHSLALKSDGRVVAWGAYGGTNIPTELNAVAAIAAGTSHSLALLSNGTVVAWGTIWNGSENVSVIVPPGLTNVEAIAAGASHDLALIGDGSPRLPAKLFNASLEKQSFRVTTGTRVGTVYILEFKEDLQGKSWQMLPPIPGDGGPRQLVDPSVGALQKVYRVRVNK
jgi:hypothetical protein